MDYEVKTKIAVYLIFVDVFVFLSIETLNSYTVTVGSIVF